jgi:hypothetical protein
MTGRIAATAHWLALDGGGKDTCRLSRAAHGWLLVGHARFRDELGFAALDYVIRLDAGWRTLSADIAGIHEAREVQARILRDGDRWQVNDTVQAGLADAVDLDLSFTPATNLMPLRRMFDSGAESVDVTAARLRYPGARLEPLDQSYARTGLPDVVSYSGRQTDYATQLTVDESGFVTRYPGLWEGEVTREG